jgi:hypothetical protein
MTVDPNRLPKVVFSGLFLAPMADSCPLGEKKPLCPMPEKTNEFGKPP